MLFDTLLSHSTNEISAVLNKTNADIFVPPSSHIEWSFYFLYNVTVLPLS